jgi:hypothetical protein
MISNKQRLERLDFINELAELCKLYHVELECDFEEWERFELPTFYSSIQDGSRWRVDIGDIYRAINET